MSTYPAQVAAVSAATADHVHASLVPCAVVAVLIALALAVAAPTDSESEPTSPM